MKKILTVLSLSLVSLLAGAAEPFPRGLSCEKPAPGRSDGRIYYYVPESLDLAKPVVQPFFSSESCRKYFSSSVSFSSK